MLNCRVLPAASLFLSLSTMMLSTPPTAEAQYPVAVGEEHPDFTFPDIESGEPVSLSGLRGQKVLLIHFASW